MPYKPEPPAATHRQLQSGCVAVSPSPPSPSPLPAAPPPCSPPTPPFPPLRAGEAIVFAPVAVVSVTFLLQGDVASINQTDLHARMVARTGCIDPCVLRLTLSTGSVIVVAEAATPAAEAQTASAVAAAFNAVVTTDPASLEDALGVKVLSVAPQVVAQSRTISLVVAPPPPAAPPPPTVPPSPPPPIPPVNPSGGGGDASGDDSTIGIVLGVGGGVLGVAAVGAGSYFYVQKVKALKVKTKDTVHV